MNKKIILLCSPLPKNGKDTVGEHLVNKYGYIRQAFADKVKECATKFFFWDGKKDQRGRDLLIDIGTMTARKYDNETWIKHVIKNIIENDLEKIVITDCRFINERESLVNSNELKEYKIYTIGIESNIFGDKDYKDNPSQIEYKDIKKDFLVFNNGTKEELYTTIDNILTFHIGG